MWKLNRWRTFTIVITLGILCCSLFSLYGFQSENSSTKNSWNLQRNGQIQPGQISDACPSNKYREIFAALLQYWHILASHHNISYVIGSGSLLGQYRDNDIIPWDEDVDILVDIREFAKLQSFAGERNFAQGDDDEFHFVVQPDFEREEREDDRRRLSCTGEEVDSQIDGCSFVSPMARVILGYFHLDVFPYAVYGEKQSVRDLDMRKMYKMNHFFPFQECFLMNVKTWCPHDIRRILESAYDNQLEPDYSCVNRTWVYKGN